MQRLLLLLLLVPMVQAVSLDVLQAPETVARGGTVDVQFAVQSDPGANATLLVGVNAPGNWNAEILSHPNQVAGGQAILVTVRITADNLPSPRTAGIQVEAATIQDGLVRKTNTTVEITASGGGKVLGLFANPFPPPLDKSMGLFLLEAFAWVVIAAAVHFVVVPTARFVTRKTKAQWDDALPQIIGMPLFVGIVSAGIKHSLEVFELPAWAVQTLDKLHSVLVVILVLIVIYRVWHQIIITYGKRVAMRTSSSVDDRLLPVLEKFGGVIIIILGIAVVLQNFGVDLTVLAAGGAVASLVLAFAAQDTLSNFFSGIHILVDQPFREGDTIQLTTGEICVVRRIGLRSTHLYHGKNNELIVVPNNQLASNRIVNLVRPDIRARVQVLVQVAYGTDLLKAKTAMLDAAYQNKEVSQDPDVKPVVRLSQFADSGLELQMWFWVNNFGAQWQTASDVREGVLQNFNAAGIEIPYPHRVILSPGKKD